MTRDLPWRQAYADLIERLPDLAGDARLTLGGFSACVDVYLALREAAPVLRSDAAGTSAEAMLDELERRALAGIGGELALEWPEGPTWINRRFSGRRAVGGTSVQAATMLAMLGAPALVALEDRSAGQLAVLHPDILVATPSGTSRCGEIAPKGDGKPPHMIFEYTAGDPIAGRSAPRSSRTIVRFDHSALERDPDFVRVSTEESGRAGAGVLCGFNELPPERAADEIAYAASVARGWRAGGLPLIHLELGDFAEEEILVLTVERLMPLVTSVGMSLSELRGIAGADMPVEVAALRLAETYGLDRVCIHADQWAFALTKADPERETEALMTGCLLASARAHEGYFTSPRSLPDTARLTAPPLSLSLQRPGWSIACCPAPYLERPAATIGLGDTFLAGTLLVLGGRTDRIERARPGASLSHADSP